MHDRKKKHVHLKLYALLHITPIIPDEWPTEEKEAKTVPVTEKNAIKARDGDDDEKRKDEHRRVIYDRVKRELKKTGEYTKIFEEFTKKDWFKDFIVWRVGSAASTKR